MNGNASVCAHVHGNRLVRRAEAVTGLEEGVYVVGTGSTGLHIDDCQKVEMSGVELFLMHLHDDMM